MASDAGELPSLSRGVGAMLRTALIPLCPLIRGSEEATRERALDVGHLILALANVMPERPASSPSCLTGVVPPTTLGALTTTFLQGFAARLRLLSTLHQMALERA